MSYGFSWDAATSAGRNLYGLSIKRCIELCREDGVVAVIAPYGWLRNERAGRLRAFIANATSEVLIDAFGRRNLFPGVSQDIAFQRFERKKLANIILTKAVEESAFSVGLSFDSRLYRTIGFSMDARNTMKGADDFVKIRVGPFVWNRQKKWLRQRESSFTVPVINGANVGQSEELNLSVKRTRERQHANRKLAASYLTRSPFIVLKRTMRGGPSGWYVDAVLVQTEGFECLAENHTIVIELRDLERKELFLKLYKILSARVLKLHKYHGHPSLSVALVRRAVNDCLTQIS